MKYFTEEEKMEMVKRFESLIQTVDRPGMDKLLAFIRKSDFYKAPASTKYHNPISGGLYHNPIPGGLLAHSLNVYDCLKRKIDSGWPGNGKEVHVPEESLIIAGLLHDICKTYYYTETFKNVKHYEKEIVEAEKAKGVYPKKDGMGEFVWITEIGYDVNDAIPYGHGEKSVMMIENYIKLTGQERYMIRWHMGFSEPKENWAILAAAISKYPEILAIFEADLEATYCLEERNA